MFYYWISLYQLVLPDELMLCKAKIMEAWGSFLLQEKAGFPWILSMWILWFVLWFWDCWSVLVTVAPPYTGSLAGMGMPCMHQGWDRASKKLWGASWAVWLFCEPKISSARMGLTASISWATSRSYICILLYWNFPYSFHNTGCSPSSKDMEHLGNWVLSPHKNSHMSVRGCKSYYSAHKDLHCLEIQFFWMKRAINVRYY